MQKRPLSGTPLVHPLILSGGSGKRLWPLSRQANPKQFLKVLGDPVSYTHLRAHETKANLVCRLLLP